MDEWVQTKLAFDLTNCQLSQANKQTPSYFSFADYLAKLERDSWATYATFYPHCENICFSYNSMIWYNEQDHPLFIKIRQASK